MGKSLLAVFDAKASTFAHPFVSVSQNVAVRDFGFAVNDPTTQLNRFSADFSLYHVGDYDESSGLITPIVPPVHIVNASSLLRPKSENDV